MAQLENIEAIEKRLWNAADTLRANSNYASNEYFMPVMGLIFLRHAYSRYLAVKDGIEANLPERGGKARPLTKEDFSQKGAIFLRPEAQFDYLVSLPDSAKRDRAIQHAMDTIEEDYDGLKGVLPKGEYSELDNDVLGQLPRTLNSEELKQASGDSLATLYLDKPLKAHTLMQAIARANRVNAGKNNGLIVDYCGILKNLRKALATFAGSARPGGKDATEPARLAEELLEDMDEAIALVRAFLAERDFRLEDINDKTGFARNAAIVAAKEAVNENDETRKRYEIMAREVFKKFKACLTVAGINDFRHAYDAINIIYKSLQIDREAADITDIIRALHGLVDDAITTASARAAGEPPRFDISKIDFERLRKEFERSAAKRSTVQTLKQVIETRLSRLLTHNPLRTDLQRHYEEIVEAYNREKDRVTIENTFAALLKFVQALDDEESRAMREGLDEESLALFDLLLKPGLGKPDIQRIKKVAAELLVALKAEKLRIDNWREKEATRDAVQVTIENFLWDDNTGLPVPAYSEEDVKTKSRDVYRHVHRVYPTIPSPFYTVH